MDEFVGAGVTDPVRRLYALSPDLMGTATTTGYLRELNPAWERALGWSLEQLRAEPFVSFLHPDDVQATLAEIVRLASPDALPTPFENRWRTVDGNHRAFQWTTVARDGLLYFTGTDVTNRRDAEDAHRRAEQLLNETQRVASMGSWEIDLATGEHRISEQLRRMLMFESAAITTEQFLDRVHPEDRARLSANMAAMAAGSPDGPGDFRIVLPDGTQRLFSSSAEPVWGDGRLPVGLRGTAQDVTATRDAEHHLARSEEQLRKGLAASPLASCLLDADSFRFLRANDAFGELVGRTRDELSARCTIRDVLHADHGDPTALRAIRDGRRDGGVIEKRFVRPDGTVVAATLYVGRVVRSDGTPDSLMVQAVASPLHPQDESLRFEATDRAWVREIEAALELDRFELYAQPIVELGTARVLHHELLIRMHDGHGHLLSPAAFLPVAERTGEIARIDRWVIRTGLDIAATGMSVSINLSGPSVGDPEILAYIDGELTRSGANPHDVIFEITETALVESADNAAALGAALRARGCRFALDDFGTGYGGFHYLKMLPLDILKIDREFVRDAIENESDRLVIWTVLSLARGFELQTVAEGIEDAVTAQLLEEMGVEFGQGYHFGRPAPIPGRRRPSRDEAVDEGRPRA